MRHPTSPDQGGRACAAEGGGGSSGGQGEQRGAMSDETKEQAAPERRDEEGLPLDRAPTLDDVRGSGGSGRTTAVSCTVVVVLALLLFWGVRAFLMR